MKGTKPQIANPVSSPAPGRKRYFVNIVTEDQALQFQNEVSAQQGVPLLRPEMRKNRLLILAPNTETISSFQKRVLTQFQYNMNVSADAVRLLESHFCEVPNSYSVADALDARSEAYLVVENIKELVPERKRPASDPAFTPPPERSPSGSEPSAKRQRRRAKQAIKLASDAEDSEPNNRKPKPSNDSRGEAVNSAPKAETVPALKTPLASTASASTLPTSQGQSNKGGKELFGRSRVEHERNPTVSATSGAPVLPISKINSNAVNNPTLEKGKSLTTEAQNTVRSAEDSAVDTQVDGNLTRNARTALETPKAEHKSLTRSPDIVSSKGESTVTPKPRKKFNEKPRASKDVSIKTDTMEDNSSQKGAVKLSNGVSELHESAGSPAKAGATAPAQVRSESHAKESSPTPRSAGEEGEEGEESESATNSESSDIDNSGSSDSESDPGERQRRLSRRRVVVTSNKPTSSANEQPGANAKKARDTPKRPEPRMDSAVDATPLETTPATYKHSRDRGSSDSLPKTDSSPTPNSRVPGLGNLADLANMRLPTVHETQRHVEAPSNEKPVEESSEEEEDNNNESDDSNDSDESDSDESADESVAGRKNRKRRGLLGLLGNK